MNSALRRRQERRELLVSWVIFTVALGAFIYAAGYALDHPANKHPSREAWEAQQRQEAAR